MAIVPGATDDARAGSLPLQSVQRREMSSVALDPTVTLHQGNTWCFTEADYVIVEGFEEYFEMLDS